MAEFNEIVKQHMAKHYSFYGLVPVFVLLGCPKPAESPEVRVAFFMFLFSSALIWIAASTRHQHPERKRLHRSLLLVGAIMTVTLFPILWQYAESEPHDRIFPPAILLALLSICWMGIYFLNPPMKHPHEFKLMGSRLFPYLIGCMFFYYAVYFVFIKFSTRHMVALRNPAALHSFVIDIEIGEYLVMALTVSVFYVIYSKCRRSILWPEDNAGPPS